MTDQTPDDPNSATLYAAASNGVGVKPLNVMTLEQVLSSAKRVERTAHICTNGALEDRFRQLSEQLGVLLDEDGNVRGGDEASLADKGRAAELQLEMEQVYEQMQAAMWHVKFRAMPDDDWDVFDAEHRPGGPGTPVKDTKAWLNEMISRCAIDPELSVDQVQALRKTFSKHQMETLGNEAYWANTTGGLDVPKLPSFSLSQQPQE